MGYACPVCETPHQDAEHLANHLAFTAILHADDHEAWLDERVPDWSERGPDDLASAVVEHVSETEYDAVFDDTAGGEHGGDAFAHDHAHDRARDVAGRGYGDSPGDVAGGDLDPETEEVLAEARDLTRQMLDEGDEDGGDDDE